MNMLPLSLQICIQNPVSSNTFFGTKKSWKCIYRTLEMVNIININKELNLQNETGYDKHSSGHFMKINTDFVSTFSWQLRFPFQTRNIPVRVHTTILVR